MHNISPTSHINTLKSGEIMFSVFYFLAYSVFVFCAEGLNK